MNSTDRTENELLPSIYKAPQKQNDIQPISNCYKSSLSSCNSDRDSVDDRNFTQKKKEIKNNNLLDLEKARDAFRQQRSFKKNQNKEILKYSKRNIMEKKVLDSNFIKTIIKQNLVLRFKNNLFTSSYVLQQNNKNILEDNYSNNWKEAKQIISQKKQATYSISSSIKYLMPETNQMIILDLILLIIYLMSLLCCLFTASFIYIEHTLKSSELFFMSIQTIELLFEIYRPIIIQGEIVITPQQIWNQYLKYTFLENLLYLGFWYVLYLDLHEYTAVNESVAILLSIIIIRKIMRKYDSQVEITYIKGINSNLIDIIKLAIMIITFAHIMACIWHYIGQITINDSSWIIKQDLEYSSPLKRYIYSYYWAIVTMVTVGYGDITPQNQIEMCFTTILIIFSSFMFAFSMNSIGVIVKNLSDSKQKYKRTLAQINSYMISYNVDEDIQRRVVNHIKMTIDKEAIENNEELTKSINSLPITLKQQLLNNIQLKIAKKISLFNSQFSQQTLIKVAEQLVQEKTTPNHIIYKINEQNNFNLYYIKSGEVNLIEEQSQKILATYKEGDTFGEFQFFTNQSPKETCLSVGFADLYKIDRENFISIVKQNKKDYERFCSIKDMLLFNSNYLILQKKCNFCYKYSHTSINCDLISYKPNLYIHILKNQKQESNSRQYIKREIFNKFNSRFMNKQVQEDVIMLQEDSSQIEQIDSIRFKQPPDIVSFKKQLSNEDIIQHKSQKSIKQQQKKKSRQSVMEPNALQQITIQNLRKGSLYKDKKTSDDIITTNQFSQLEELEKQIIKIEISGFDCIGQYLFYYPHNNFANIIKQYYQYYQKLKKKETKMKSLASKLFLNSKFQLFKKK